ncbi:hypothetical protein ACSVH5_11070 [Flavobacterium sp. RSSA_27]|uniref:hypothetical protein n=1 Tax=Flavobacterium sp. RSSA_27 TaxID=3447667 RepID=UPI003F387FB0
MRFDKVVYLRYMPLTAKVYSDFYMGEADLAGLKVEYWDLTSIFFEDNHGMEDSSYLAKVRKFTNYTELEFALKNEELLSKTLFISIMTFEGRISKLYQLLTKYNCILSVFGRNMFPLPSPPKSLLGTLGRIKIATVLNYFRFKRVLKLMKNGKIKKYDIVFQGGEQGWKGIGRVDFESIKDAEIVKVNSDDYDTYLMLKNEMGEKTDQYILFLDEYLPLHPDTVLFNIKNVKVEDYYPELNSYFDRVEKQYGLPVVIAAHPKAIRYKTEDFFNGRKVVFNETAQLTNNAFFVLAHDSTSINYPIASGKKLHFITSKNILNGIGQVHRNVVHFSDYLGCNYQFMNIDEKVNLVDELPIKNYEKYKYSFQTSPETEDKLSSKIFIDFLLK